jgi:lysophospholipase L1-like esterase
MLRSRIDGRSAAIAALAARALTALKVLLVLLVLPALAGLTACTDKPPEAPRVDRVALQNAEDRDRTAGESKVILLGSSTMARITSAQMPDAVNLGVGGDSIRGLTARMANYKSPSSARAVVLLIGLNDLLSTCRLPTEELRQLAMALPPGVPVVWVGVQGVAPKKRATSCIGNLAALSKDLNELISRACGSHPRCRYLPNPIPEGVDQADSERLHAPDGIHLSEAGYGLLLRRLALALEPTTDGRVP